MLRLLAAHRFARRHFPRPSACNDCSQCRVPDVDIQGALNRLSRVAAVKDAEGKDIVAPAEQHIAWDEQLG